MPAHQQSLRLTELYRRRLVENAARAQALAAEFWPQIGQLDESNWPAQAAEILARAQRNAVRLSAGYLTAYVGSELGKRQRLVAIPVEPFVGVSRDGRPLTEALRSPIIGVLGALKAGKSSSEALNLGLVRAKRMVGFEAVQTGRDALLDAIGEDARTDGHARSVSGTCAACMALSGTSGPKFEVHPGCECIPVPTVSGVTDRFPLPSGASLFAALTKPEQEKAIGPEAAALVRDGDADLKDFVSHSHTDTDQPNWITQRPVEQVAE